MRAIEVRKVEDIHAVWVADEYTGLQFTKTELNLMLDDLMASYRSTRTREDLLSELVQKSLVRAARSFEEGPLTPEEVKEVIRLVGKSCGRGS